VLLLLEPLHQPWMYHFANLKYLATSNCWRLKACYFYINASFCQLHPKRNRDFLFLCSFYENWEGLLGMH
jgi:hypothetical protein